MKIKPIYFLLSLILFTKVLRAKDKSNPPRQNISISFTENKGQFADQNYNPRPDVLFGGSDGQLTFHITNKGISYQLNRVDEYKEVEDPKTKEKRKEIDQQSIYRVDIKWLNANLKPLVKTDEALPGYNNYYLQHCPNGALNVRSYKGITLQNIYNNIDLHYYEKDGQLKYDYVVAPHTDYKQIQLKIQGANLKLQEDGSLLIETPLGKIQEQAPVVYQNGKQLKAYYTITNNNTIGFEIQNYNSNYKLIIDPVARLWGTYYGGTGWEYGMSCRTDLVGNVYMTGYTSTSTSSVIATTGSHQSTSGGFNDVFLVKFNSSGVRQWGTFAGGSQNDMANASVIFGPYVYVVGITTSSSGTVLATSGSHQSSFGGGGDAFLIKFDTSGVRQWGTLYGGAGIEYGISCSTDNSGDIYMTGTSGIYGIGSTAVNSGTVMVTTGCQQSTNGGGNTDAYLVKFSSSGVRQWGTYYGGSGDEGIGSCVVDIAGNIYLAGSTSSSVSAVMTTSGCHQANYGGNLDAFLVKFNSSGIRTWGTYYGGVGGDSGNCAIDASGNVFVSGSSSTNTGTAIATPGSYQSIHGGGTDDGFLAQFNSSGVRQWGTYYGSAGDDYITASAINASGNIYLAGMTTGSVGTMFATTGSQQTYFGGDWDAYLAKFNNSGLRIWGTYYGSTSAECAYNCAIDPVGNIYMTGYTQSNTGTEIATPGSHQSTFGGIPSNDDAFLVKFTECSTPAQPSVISGPTSVCSGAPQIYNVINDVLATYYTWKLPSGWSGTSLTNSISVSGSSSGIFTLTANNPCASPIQTLFVNVNPTPTVTVNSGSICSGNNFTITPLGANSYSISGNTFTVNPGITTSYSVTGSSTAGCVSNNVVGTVTVNATPTISVNSGSMCTGNNFIITPSGANTYTITGGNYTVNPAISTSYSVTGTSAAGCISTGNAVSSVTVNTTPTVSVNSGSICSGNGFTITTMGANTYTVTGGNFTVSPGITSSYSVTGTSTAGCVSANAVSHVTVYATPTVVVNSGSICSGNSFTITPTGASSYTVAGGIFTVSPVATTIYSVIGSSTAGCVSTGAALSEVTVHAIPVIAVNSGSICSGHSFTISPSGASTFTITGGNFIVSPISTSSYSVNGTSMAGCNSSGYAVSTITVNITPTISVNNGSICSGESFTIMPSGASNYTINGGSFTLSPIISSSYSVSGTSAEGCVSASAVSNITVHATPTVGVNSGSICSGNNFTIIPSGANTYTITGGSYIVSPTTTSSYSVTGTSTAGCVSSVVAISNVSVQPIPILVVNSGSICLGESFIITPTGANTYSISSGNFTVSPTITSSYTVGGTNTEGCNSPEVLSTVVVNDCVGVNENSGIYNASILMYPNPNNGKFNIESDRAADIKIIDIQGRLVYTSNVYIGTNKYSIEHLENGIYLIAVIHTQGKQVFRIIKQ